jgi:RNA polymerase sigma-70 factor (ECF subfamily)
MLRKDRLRRWEQTDDVLQEALVQLHKSLRDIHPESVPQFFGLAALQIRRTLIDLARHHFGPHGQAKHHHTEGKGVAADDAGGNLDEQAKEPEDLDDWTRFHEAVQALPERERIVFDLIWYDGLTHADAASVLGVDERTIRRRWLSIRSTFTTSVTRPE